MSTLRLGVIGCGNMCKNHLNPWVERSNAIAEDMRPYAERVVVQATADVSLEKAEDYKEKYGAQYATDDMDRVLTDPDVDAVLISTWHDTHAPYSLAALDNGKHVLIEKPMCMTLQECDDILAAVERTGLTYMPAFRARFAMGAKDVKREIPEPENVIAFARFPSIWPETIWAQDPIKGGGQILSQGCHIVDLMFFLAGAEPVSVYATGGVYHHDKPDCIDTINAAIRFENGSSGAFLGGDGGTANLMMHHPLAVGCPFWVMAMDKGRSGMAIDHGHDARFEKGSSKDWTPPYDSKVYSQEVGAEASGGVPNILPHFAQCVLDGATPLATAHDGARATRFILKAFESARSGEVVAF